MSTYIYIYTGEYIYTQYIYILEYWYIQLYTACIDTCCLHTVHTVCTYWRYIYVLRIYIHIQYTGRTFIYIGMDPED